ncbi:hypothetical protein H8356DRAFT_1087337 [Neocallimastix lanati (nom. inval.)]|uniref:Uncharacterized protein n=1 Tax=Neocallimastix californiae TaxID=1754190 RepID=A0A1Y2DDJ4_9FUNG|nr:hypothetical protein H8356DRAFT_1087337 [Neocallimastix sp. JGI-2020a]ORY57353.1 hypothetical protein LY90DRAFT_506507 [Neocallimastix californiae]|eukprot:ORY57353.1 hypothetical protein LY90DRAFT_506507 [Neocallimastix californiae]
MFIKNFDFSLLLSCLYKYDFITVELFRLFYPKIPQSDCKFEVFEFLTDNNKILLEKIHDSIYSINHFECIFHKTCRSLKLLKYLSESFADITKSKCSSTHLNFLLYFPFEVLKKYSNVFYRCNKLYVKCNDKYYEDFINTMCDDESINFFITHKGLESYYRNTLLNRYNFYYNDKLNYEVVDNPKFTENYIENDNSNKPYYLSYDEYIKLKEPKKYNRLNKYYIKLSKNNEFEYDFENISNLNFC